MWTPKRILIFLTALVGFLAVFAVFVTVLGWVDGLPNLPPHYVHNPDDTRPDENPAAGLGPENVRDFKIRQAFGKECEEYKRQSKVYLASKGAVLAIDQYEIEKDGRVKMTPFSLGLFAKNTKGEQRFPEITTVQSDIAYLTLDRPITSLTDLARSKVVKVELGGLGMVVTIKNNRKTPELNDDLEMRVKDRQLYYEDARNLIWSDGVVELLDTQSQPEPTRITAIGLRVDLSKDSSPNRDKKAATAKKTEGVSGVEKITLLSNVDMHLYVESRSGFMAGPDELAKKPAAKADPQDKAHIHIKTNGTFEYDLVNETARFDAPKQTALVQDRVIVTRHQNAPWPKGGGFTDLLDCDRLDLEFRKKAGGEPGSNDKEIQSAIATARPGADVKLQLDSEMMEAYGAEMRYFASKQASGPKTIIKGSPMHALRQGHQIQCEELHLTGADKAGNGQEAFAKGPGQIDLLDKQTGRSSTHILFEKSFTVTDDKDEGRVYKLLTLRGNAAYIDDERKQELRAAKALKVWLEEVKVEPAKAPPVIAGDPAKKAEPEATRRQQPHKVEGHEDVKLRSPQMNILHTNHLTVYFREQSAPPVEKTIPFEKAFDGVPAFPTLGAPRGEATTVALPKNPNDKGPNALLLPPSPKSGDSAKTESEKAKKPLEMTAGEITAYVARIGNTNELLEFVADGKVHVTQAADNPKDKGLEITGKILNLVRQPLGDILRVFGNPPDEYLRFNEMMLFGPDVMIDQVRNIAEVTGVGAMRMPSSTTVDGKKKDGFIEIHWNKSMLFDGRFANFYGLVQAFQGNGKMLADEMQVKLDKPVYFKQTKESQNAKVDRIVCYRDSKKKDDQVWILEEERQKDNKIAVFRRMNLASVDIDNLEQHLVGYGPGSLDFIGLSSANDPGINPVPKDAPNDAKMKANDVVEKWTRIRFNGKVMSWPTAGGGGRETRFVDNVRVFHQPGNNPDLKDPDPLAIGKDGLFLHCQKLTVVQRKVGEKSSQEMLAHGGGGSVTFRTQQFHGFAKTVKYDESKDSIVFDDSVTIWEIPKVRGADPKVIRGSQILYNRKTGLFTYDGVQSINWSW